MVGHSGKTGSGDQGGGSGGPPAWGRFYQAFENLAVVSWIITADHGNAETMIDPAGPEEHTPTTYDKIPVPLILVSDDDKAAIEARRPLCVTLRPRCSVPWGKPSAQRI